jgi:flagellar basal-body rod protein FlgB
MDIGEIPLFAMLRQRLGYLGERQRVIAQNVANADTPGYRPVDLKPFTFKAALDGQIQGGQTQGGQTQGGMGQGAPPLTGRAMAPQQTEPGHMAGFAPLKGGTTFKSKAADDSETTLDGNSVNLEDQMIKLTDARTQYDAAIGFYQKSLGLLRMAARRPGG